MILRTGLTTVQVCSPEDLCAQEFAIEIEDTHIDG
jgi:hypothetical protein